MNERFVITCRFSTESEYMRKKRGNCTAHVKVMCDTRRTIIRRICLSSQSSLRSWPPHPAVELNPGEGVNSNHMFSFQLPLCYLQAAVTSSAGRALIWTSQNVHFIREVENIYLIFPIKLPVLCVPKPSSFLLSICVSDVYVHACVCVGGATCIWGA